MDTTFTKGQRVRLAVPVKNADGFPGDVVPAGACGTVVEAFAPWTYGGEGYTVTLDGDPEPDMPMYFEPEELEAAEAAE